MIDPLSATCTDQVTSPCNHLNFLMEVSMTACFSGQGLKIEGCQIDGKSLLKISRSGGKFGSRVEIGHYQASSESIREFLGRIQGIIAIPEQHIEGRSTTVYRGRLSAIPDLNIPSIDTRSSLLPKEVLEEIITDSRSQPDLVERIKTALSEGYHIWAHELFSVAHAFADQITLSPEIRITGD